MERWEGEQEGEIKGRFDKGFDNPGATDDDGAAVRPARPDLVISIQPQQGTRAELPVTTVNWQSNPRGQFIPTHGLDFLIGVPSILIQQTVELNDLTSRIESENRYIVMVPGGEALYIASETSSSTQRCLCGTGRAFTMHIHDNTRQEAMVMKRRLAAASCCFPCRLQEMKVITPPGDYIGRIHQKWSWMVPFYLVRDANDDVLFVIEGPAVIKRSALMLAEFKILTGDSLRELGKIVHGWDRELVNFTTTLHFPDSGAQPKHKALLLAAAFLMEYTYFERAKGGFGRCNCF
ncbi:scramblase domain-containing protein [Phthorimaea operculella]|nr:scramblase domain-containing protein [Phthorimaea operculella]